MTVTTTRPRLFVNGNIRTGDAAFSRASVLAVRDGIILYTGSDRERARALLPGEADIVDLAGRTVLPGLIDSHLHLKAQGQQLMELDLRHKSREDILAMVRAEAALRAPGEWIVGRGWNHELWPDSRWPGKEELDAASPRNPVSLTRADSHSVWVNSPALRAAGFDRNSPDPRGGEVLRAANGDPQGILVDTAMLRVWAVIPPLDAEATRKAYLTAQAGLFRLGITSVGDAWQTPADFAALRRACEEGEMKLRVHGMLSSVEHDGKSVFSKDMLPCRGLCGERLSLAAFKVVLDGSLGSRSALMTREYADRPGHKGNRRYEDEELFELVRDPALAGFQICAHAIGDAAVRQALNVLEQLDALSPARERRHRIEHFQTAGPEEVERALRLGVIPAMQTIHHAADRAMAAARLDAASLARSYPWRPVLDGGGIIANGSDSPMEDGNPFHGFHAAIARTPFAPDAEGDPARCRMTRDEALRSYTLWAAFAEGAEARKGSLEAGKLADFAVLDRDIMACPQEEIPETRVLMTVLDGETVYAAG